MTERYSPEWCSERPDAASDLLRSWEAEANRLYQRIIELEQANRALRSTKGVLQTATQVQKQIDERLKLAERTCYGRHQPVDQVEWPSNGHIHTETCGRCGHTFPLGHVNRQAVPPL